jgi:hypothetical protein
MIRINKRASHLFSMLLFFVFAFCASVPAAQGVSLSVLDGTGLLELNKNDMFQRRRENESSCQENTEQFPHSPLPRHPLDQRGSR